MNVSLFLGAGASVPYGFPTTAQFKEKLKHIPDKPDPNTLDYFLDNPKYLDIEHILKAIEEIQLFAKTRGASFFEKTIKFAYADIPTPFTFENIISQMDQNYLKIKEYVYKFYSWDDSKSKMIEQILGDVFSVLSKSTNGIHVFTTNYDQTIEHYADDHKELECNDGFVHNRKNRKSIFDETSFSEENNNQKRVHLYKLHGSLNWKKTPYGMISLDRDENDVNNLVIYPTFSPKNGTEIEPFKTIRNKFETHLEKTDIFIVIGYSFRDNHINQLFKKFLNDPTKMLFVIYPSSHTDVKDNFFNDGNKYGTTILQNPSEPQLQLLTGYYHSNTKYNKCEMSLKNSVDNTQIQDFDAAKNQLDNSILKLFKLEPHMQVFRIVGGIEQANQHNIFPAITRIFELMLKM